MNGKNLGKISGAQLGHDGDGRFGLRLDFDMHGSGVSTFVGHWSTRPERAQWTTEDQAKAFADVMYLLRDTLTAAKRRDVSQLVGIPVEVTIEGGMLKSWRVLEEVL